MFFFGCNVLVFFPQAQMCVMGRLCTQTIPPHAAVGEEEDPGLGFLITGGPVLGFGMGLGLWQGRVARSSPELQVVGELGWKW